MPFAFASRAATNQKAGDNMKNVLLAILLMGGALNANALLINTSVGDYEVTTTLCTFDDLACKGLLDDQAWWGNSTLAEEFATQTGDFFGRINPYPLEELYVYFAYGQNSVGLVSGCSFNFGCFEGLTSNIADRYWATATPADTQVQVQVPAPATLALFGLGLAGLGWSRRRKA